jgi:hypothetical protein
MIATASRLVGAMPPRSPELMKKIELIKKSTGKRV